MAGLSACPYFVFYLTHLPCQVAFEKLLFMDVIANECEAIPFQTWLLHVW